MNILKPIAAFVFFAIFAISQVYAQAVPLAISYQAALNDDLGDPLSPATPTNYPIVFRIYDAVEDGNLLWAEAQNVSVFQGSFSTLLGTGDEVTGEPYPLLDTIFDDSLRYLEVTITDGSEKTFEPRQRMVSAPFAFRAKIAEHALAVADDAISTDQIENGTITLAKLAPDSVSSSQIQSGSVGSSEVANNAIGTSELEAQAVELEKLAAAVVNRLQPAGSVTAWAGVSTARTVGTGETLSGVPGGWLLCDGGSVAVASYPDLFNAIGYLYGGSGNNFNLPDYRGYFLRGQASNASEDPDRGSRLSATDWADENGLLEGSAQEDELRSHSHVWGHWDTNDNSGDYNQEWDTGGGRQSYRRYDTEETGGSETRPKNKYVWYIIKAH